MNTTTFLLWHFLNKGLLMEINSRGENCNLQFPPLETTTTNNYNNKITLDYNESGIMYSVYY